MGTPADRGYHGAIDQPPPMAKTTPPADTLDLDLVTARLADHQRDRDALQIELDNTPICGDNPAETRQLQAQAARLRESISGLDEAIAALQVEQAEAQAQAAQAAAADLATRDLATVAAAQAEMKALAQQLAQQREA
ncbi:MAG: hypothetical protein HC929_22270 [Leptolyngbyaceae cyanobacterium SM2_5_2]|nr:hypothetical protein [Leptolyngbyaceae cyanobacterium SM2_5_2]